MKLVIDRSKWLRGDRDSYLLRPSDQKMCCVGMYLAQCGVPLDDLRWKVTAEDVLPLPVTTQWLVATDNDLAVVLYGVNDDRTLTEEDREVGIASEFAKVGVQVEFR